MVKIVNLEERKFMNKAKKLDRKQKIKALAEYSKLDPKMGELFLTEIKLSTDEANAHLRERVKLLGL